MRINKFLFTLVSIAWVLSSCTSHLEDAKFHYVQAQKFSRSYRTEIAIGAYKKSLEESIKEVEKSPSSQAFMLKGLAELHLNLWEDSEQSFLAAFSYGFDKGQEWAECVSLFGLAAAMQELGLSQSAFQIYAHLVDKSRLKPGRYSPPRNTWTWLSRGLFVKRISRRSGSWQDCFGRSKN